jgi:AmmeMemoRadiSam system protein A
MHRVAAAAGLLIVAILIVVWVARSHSSHRLGHSHDPASTSGDRGSPEAAKETPLPPEEQRFLLGLARKTLQEIVTTGNLPKVDTSGISSRLLKPTGCFVTLTKHGVLRGCIGYIFPQEPLYKAVMDNARSAAVEDTRFRPVQPEELEEIEIEISVLTPPRELKFSSPEDLLNKLRPGKDGVVLAIGRRRSTYLPQVWKQLPTKEEFLGHLCVKAGSPPTAWRDPGTEVLVYQAEAFQEPELSTVR